MPLMVGIPPSEGCPRNEYSLFGASTTAEKIMTPDPVESSFKEVFRLDYRMS